MTNQEEFYDLPGPAFLQQGDLLSGVPLIGLPPSKDLVILRKQGSLAIMDEIQPGIVSAVSEAEIAAFDDGGPEYIAASAQRGTAMLLTQTCNLARDDEWVVAPVYSIEGTGIESGNLFAGDLTGLFCTSRREREFTRRTAGYAKQEVQSGTDRDVAAPD